MRLINPQPMETLPESGRVFIQRKHAEPNTVPVRYCSIQVELIRQMISEGIEYAAWSYEATTREEEA